MNTSQLQTREDRERANPTVKAQADRFEMVRRAHQVEVVEDYVELIAELIESLGEARTVDIAERLGVKQPTVTKTIARLQALGMVRRERYRAIFLTEQGQALAKACRKRHQIVVSFLCSLGIDEETAERDAEGIEHHVSETTLKIFEARVADQTNPKAR